MGVLNMGVFGRENDGWEKVRGSVVFIKGHRILVLADWLDLTV